MDLAGALAYWIQADDDDGVPGARAGSPRTCPGMLTRAEMVDYYTARIGLSVTPEQWRFYEVFGLFRLGGDRPADLLPLPPRADHQRGLRPLPARWRSYLEHALPPAHRRGQPG